MARNKLTARQVDTAKPRESRYQLADGGSLFVWIYPTGSKVWIYRYRRRTDAKQDYVTLGELPLATARVQRDECAALLRQGIDPKTARAAAVAETSAALTMSELADRWLDHLRAVHEITPRTIDNHASRWRLHLQKGLGKLHARDLTRAHIATQLDGMRRKGIKEEVRKALTTVKLMLDYGVSRHLLDSNPAAMIKPKDFAASASTPRTRALSLAELRKLWVALDGTATGVADALRLLVLTGARRGEVAGMQWDEIDLERGTWTIPAHRAKNRKAHVVYLSDAALRVIRSDRPSKGEVYVLESSRKQGAPIGKDSLTNAIDKLQKREMAEVSGFSVHDLRRSAATAWAENLKVAPHIIERMLNHVPANKLVATYQRAEYQAEQEAAWLAWGNLVDAVIAQHPGNVVPITPASRSA